MAWGAAEIAVCFHHHAAPYRPVVSGPKFTPASGSDPVVSPRVQAGEAEEIVLTSSLWLRTVVPVHEFTLSPSSGKDLVASKRLARALMEMITRYVFLRLREYFFDFPFYYEIH